MNRYEVLMRKSELCHRAAMAAEDEKMKKVWHRKELALKNKAHNLKEVIG